MRKTRGAISKKLILQIEPIAFLDDATPIYPIMGSEDDPQDEGNGDDDDEGEGDGDEDDSEEDESKKPKRKPKAKETDAQKIRRLNAENRERRLALEAAEKKIRDAEDAGKSELEIAKRDLAELQAKYDKVPETLDNLRVENAFLKLRGYDWHDPADALERILKDPDVSIAEDGTVEGLEDAVKAIAKSKPYLLKKKGDEEEGDGKGGPKRPPRGPSGATLGGVKSPKGDQAAARAADLKKKYKIW